ncbi:BPL-N domain-containing protein [Amycolatopsis sp. NPDC059021]|uniref:BPL-N domain-containing protein n=1 Tax=Amycolatopsis sp. NPDC059021 TaxID=3346704 RepID=UPI00367185BA
MRRRTLLIGAGAVVAAGGLGWAGVAGFTSDDRPLALVYRGPAACEGCAEAVATLLRGTTTPLRVEYCGPGEATPLTRASLDKAVLYAQPGGGSLDDGWRKMRRYADDIRGWVADGGRYVGFCLGGYLAGATPGFNLLPGDTDQYIASRKASVRTTQDTVVTVSWRGRDRTVYFQDGPEFKLRPGSGANVLATYDTGTPAAVVVAHGKGRVGVVGPHPEADATWYRSAKLAMPGGGEGDLGRDLVETTLA